MKHKTNKRSAGIIAIVLVFLLLFSGILVPIIKAETPWASAATDGEDVYSAGNTYQALVEQRVETIDGVDYTYDFATYNLKTRSSSSNISKNPPQVTFLTHGLFI